MKTLAEAVVELAAFLDLAEHIGPHDAQRELEKLGALIGDASAEEKQALREAAAARSSEHVFFEQFPFSFGLDE